LREHGQLGQDAVGDRRVERRLELEQVVRSAGDGSGAAQFRAGLLGGDVDRAADGVAAEQRALRPAQHFEVSRSTSCSADPTERAMYTPST
jgi:hypothetical protein